MEIKVNVSLSLSPDLEALINRAFAALVNPPHEVEEITSGPITTGYAQEMGLEEQTGTLATAPAPEKPKANRGRPTKKETPAAPVVPIQEPTNGTVAVPEELEVTVKSDELSDPEHGRHSIPAPSTPKPAPAPAPSASPIVAPAGTLQQIISMAALKATAGKRPQIKALLDDFMCPSLSAIPSEEQGRFLTALQAI